MYGLNYLPIVYMLLLPTVSISKFGRLSKNMPRRPSQRLYSLDVPPIMVEHDLLKTFPFRSCTIENSNLYVVFFPG